ncbi:hypothetical protein Tco_0975675 [Tanacetum coccineum]|uniref:Uncharacterized protein n=1 Tax=Tanacetum coccineum TaxID=301880 RepID=A0ABQ5EF28_9ASTR
MDAAESSAPKRSTVICFCLPERKSTRLTPPAPVPTVDKVDEMILQDTLQVSLAEHKSREEQEARENVEITNDEEVEITNVVIPVNVNEEEEEITDEVYELKRREKGKIVEESRSTPFPTPIRSHRIHTDFVSSDTRISWFLSRKSFDTLADHLQEVMLQQITQYVVDASVRSYMSGHILHVHPVQSQTPSVPKQQYQLPSAVRPRDHEDPHDDVHPEGENINEEERDPSTLGNQEQVDDYDFWTDSYASDDDEIPTKQVSQDIMKEVSLTIDEAKLKKMADEMLRQRVEKHTMFSIIYEPVHGIIYKNSKKEKRVMRHSEIHKFCDATLIRVLEGLKSYNNDVKYGYVQRELTNDEVEYLKLFEEEIEVRLKYRNQMRRWEMYVNGRPLGPRRERPE